MYVMAIPYMDLDQIYESYGMLNWHKVSSGKYIIVHGDKVVKVEQRRENFVFSCSEEDFNNIWYKYFDVNTDYLKLHYMFRNVDEDEEFKIYCNRGRGVRILRLDIFETILLAIAIHYYKDEKQAHILVHNTLSSVCCKKRKNSMGDAGAFVWREVPKPEDIIKHKDKILKLDVDKRFVQDIIELSQNVVDGWLDIGMLSIMDMDAAIDYLKDYDWCKKDDIIRFICLYGLHDLMTFAYSKEIDSKIKKDFGMGYYKWLDYYLAGETKYINNLGYICQVIRYNIANPITKTNYDKNL